jgi:hypothetical protein
MQEWHGAGKNYVRKDWARNQAEQETTKGHEETVQRPGMQQWRKEPRTKSAATQQNVNKGSSYETAATSWK